MSNGVDGAPVKGHRTLPPPEWRPSAPSSQVQRVPSSPLVRRKGRAVLAELRREIEDAEYANDPARAERAARALYEQLDPTRWGIKEALAAAELLLAHASDPTVFEQLATWRRQLGELSFAAAALGHAADLKSDVDAAYARVRAAVLWAQAGEKEAAVSALARARECGLLAALCDELTAAMGSGSSDRESVRQAAELYVRAARVRRDGGDTAREVDDLFRAWALAPASEEVATALADSFRIQGKGDCACEVERLYAAAISFDAPEKKRAIHARQRIRAASLGDWDAAFTAALDEGLDAIVQGAGAKEFDQLLVELKMFDVLAARMELRAARGYGRERAKHFRDLARLSEGILADSARALAARICALAADPHEEDLALAAHTMQWMHRPATVPLTLVPFGGTSAEWLNQTAAIQDEAARRRAWIQRFATAVGGDPSWRTTLVWIDRWFPVGRVSTPPPPVTNVRAAAASAWIRARVSGDAHSAAECMARYATFCNPRHRATLLCSAALVVASAGMLERARGFAVEASRADSAMLRPLVIFADLLRSSVDRSAAILLEQAIVRLGPRASWCALLADSLEELGEATSATAWGERHLSLLGGNPAVFAGEVARFVRLRDGERLADALTWLPMQPIALDAARETLVDALLSLVELVPGRASLVLQRILDSFGVANASIRSALFDATRRLGDPSVERLLLLRSVDVTLNGTRGQLLLALAGHCERLGDLNAEACAYARWLKQGGAAANQFEERVSELLRTELEPDVELELVRAHAETLTRAGKTKEAANAWRRAAAEAWDLLDDRAYATKAWLFAIRSGGVPFIGVVASDMCAIGGAEFAWIELDKAGQREADPAAAAAMFTEAASLAMHVGKAETAFELANRALGKDPWGARPLSILEKVAPSLSRETSLAAVFEHVASRALGRFSRRAIHYRAARFFDRSLLPEVAYRHAERAFLAIPSTGTAYEVMLRTAMRAGAQPRVIKLLTEYGTSLEPAEGALWLDRAADVEQTAGSIPIEAAMRATLMAPTLERVERVSKLVQGSPDKKQALEVVRALDQLKQDLAGPQGAYLALAVARLFAQGELDVEAALNWLERAVHADSDLVEYATLNDHVGALVKAKAQGALAFVTNVVERAEKATTFAGSGLLNLCTALAFALQDPRLAVRAAILSVERDSDDSEGVRVLEFALADAGVHDESIAARYARAVTVAQRIEALRNSAQKKLIARAFSEAIECLERAAVLSQGEERDQIERELAVVYESSGRVEDAERRAERDAERGDLLPAARADRWIDIANRREVRGDLDGATRAMLEATNVHPEPLERWSQLERVAEAAGLHEVRVQALLGIRERVTDDAKIAVERRLARAQQDSADWIGLEGTIRRIVAAVPWDDELAAMQEELLVKLGRHEELADFLAARIRDLTDEDDLSKRRALRLRRAAVLDQKLSRLPDSCEELERLLNEANDLVPALRHLATLRDRLKEFDKSALLWSRAAALEEAPDARNALELPAAEAWLKAGDPARALVNVRAILSRRPDYHGALRLKVALLRKLEDKELTEALDRLAEHPSTSERDRVELWVEAAEVLDRQTQPVDAIQRAEKAVAASPLHGPALLVHAYLRYKNHGAGAPDEARRTIEQLSSLEPSDSPKWSELRVFLLAEALDAVQGGGVGLRELLARDSLEPGSPLIALGIAERYLAQGQYGNARPHFETALDGEFYELRSPGVVALAAAECAIRERDSARALELLDRAMREPKVRLAASLRLLDVALGAGRFDRVEGTLCELARQHDDRDAQRALLQWVELAWGSVESPKRGQLLVALDAMLVVVPGTEGKDLTTWISSARRAIASGPPRSRATSTPPASLPPSSRETPIPPTPRDFLGPPQVSLAHAAEQRLLRDLGEGSLVAGDELASFYAMHPERSRDLLRVRRLQMDFVPGDRVRLEQLRRAAHADGNAIYVRALEHVASALDGSSDNHLMPPLLGDQIETGILLLLQRPSRAPVGEAFALACEGAARLFARDASEFGVTGLMRVAPGLATPLARAYESALKLLDIPKIPIFLTGSGPNMPLAATVAMMTPHPAVLLAGDIREETPELRFVLGRGMSAALPANVLHLGLPPRTARAVYDAMLGAFGPPEFGKQLGTEAAELAHGFWQVIPAAFQRRIKELMNVEPVPEFAEICERAHQSGRRVGLFLSGDFAVAARALLREQNLPEDFVGTPSTFKETCSRIPAMADLFRLAVSPEFAEARWRTQTASARGGAHASRFNLA